MSIGSIVSSRLMFLQCDAGLMDLGVGPLLGTVIAVFFYKFIKMLEYEMANPGQDGDDKNDPTQNAEKRAEVMQRRDRRQRPMSREI